MQGVYQINNNRVQTNDKPSEHIIIKVPQDRFWWPLIVGYKKYRFWEINVCVCYSTRLQESPFKHFLKILAYILQISIIGYI